MAFCPFVLRRFKTSRKSGWAALFELGELLSAADSRFCFPDDELALVFDFVGDLQFVPASFVLGMYRFVWNGEGMGVETVCLWG